MKQELIQPAAAITATLLAQLPSFGALGLVHDQFIAVYRELERAQEQIGKEDQERSLTGGHPPLRI